MNMRLARAAVFATKYLPVIAAFIMLFHVFLLCLNIRGAWAENMLILIFSVILYVNDKAYGFCLLHRLLGCYSVLVWWCINIERYIGFGTWLDFMHVLVALLGTVLFILLLSKSCRHTNSKYSKENSRQ